MPRRAPPTPLRLYQGPLPPRSRPKHTLPSLPCPTFRPRLLAMGAPNPRSRAQSIDDLLSPHSRVMFPRVGQEGLHAHIVVHMPSVWTLGEAGACESERSMPVSPSGSTVSDRSSDSVNSGPTSPRRERVMVRGPWDHSGSIKIPFDVEAVLAPPRPAMLNAGPLR